MALRYPAPSPVARKAAAADPASSSSPSTPGSLRKDVDRPSFSTLRPDFVILKTASPTPAKSLVHKDLLTHFSPYFFNLLNGPWKEARDGIREVTLEEGIEPETLFAYVDWLYYERLPGPSLNEGEEEEEEVAKLKDGEVERSIERLALEDMEAAAAETSASLPGAAWSFSSIPTAEEEKEPTCPWELSLLHLYALASYHLTPTLLTALITHTHHIYNTTPYVPFYTTLLLAFDTLPHTSPMCRLLVDVFSAKWLPGSDSEEERRVSRELGWEVWYRVLVRMAGGRGEGVWVAPLEDFMESD